MNDDLSLGGFALMIANAAVLALIAVITAATGNGHESLIASLAFVLNVLAIVTLVSLQRRRPRAVPALRRENEAALFAAEPAVLEMDEWDVALRELTGGGER